MSRRKKDPLRALTETETQTLQQISRSQAASVMPVTRAHILLRVAQGSDYQQAARGVGGSDVGALSKRVSRFNQEGLHALTPRQGGGACVRYEETAKAL